MFYKGDSVYLYIVDFGSEFNGFGFLASDNGAKVMPVDTHAVSYTHLIGKVDFRFISNYRMHISRNTEACITYFKTAFTCFCLRCV